MREGEIGSLRGRRKGSLSGRESMKREREGMERERVRGSD